MVKGGLGGAILVSTFVALLLGGCGNDGSIAPAGTPPPAAPACLIGSGGGNPITIPVSVPSRTSGVAPLAVFFDATQTQAIALTSRPFHELEYLWHFDDITSGVWGFGSRAGTSQRTVATGPVAAHVFETPGTYGVCVTVTDGVNVADAGYAITVEDPEVVFAGSTVCVSNDADFTDCPVACTPTTCRTSADFDNVINGIAGSGNTFKRILFHAGHAFTASATAVINANGPGLVGSFGAGAKPVIGGALANAKLSLGASLNPAFGDWRIVDLRFSGSAGGFGISHGGTSNRVTIQRVEIDGTQTGIQFDINVLDAHNNPVRTHELYSELAIVDSVITNPDQYGIFGGASKLMVMGNRIHNAANEHGMRNQYTRYSVVSNNEFGIAFRTSLTMRGIEHFTAQRVGGSITGSRTLNDQIYTEFGVISDNRFIGGNAAIPVTLKSVNSVEDARFRNHIFERNWTTLGTAGIQPLFQTESGDLTIRNNLFDSTTAAGAQIAIGFSKSTGTPAPASNIDVFNNTHVSNKVDAGNAFRIVGGGGAATNVRIKNNLGYAPNNTNVNTEGVDLGALGVPRDVTNNSTNLASIRTNPVFVAFPPTTTAHWQASAGFVVDDGTTVPVFTDFFLAPRTGTYDLGAVNPP